MEIMECNVRSIQQIGQLFWFMDPIAQMQLEYDRAVEQLKEGRIGLEQYRGLVERVFRQVSQLEKREQQLTARIKVYLKANDRQTAGQLAIQLQETQQTLTECREQLKIHEQAYDNNLEKIKHSSKNLAKIQSKIFKYRAELKMSKAEAEMSRLSQTFNFDLTTDFSQIEQVIHDRIDLNRGQVRVVADLAERGLDEIRSERSIEEALAEDLLTRLETDMGLTHPKSNDIVPEDEKLGPMDDIRDLTGPEAVTPK